MNKKSVQSYGLMIGSMLIFGTIGIFRKFIPLSSAFLAFARGVLGTVFLCIFVKVRGRKLFHGIGKKNFFLLFAIGAGIGVNWLLLFEAYNRTTVAIATLCYYMAPTIVILLSPLVFREKLTAKKLLCALISIIGMVFVSGVFDTSAAAGGSASSGTTPAGILFGLGAAVLYAVVVILNKKVQIEDAYEKTVIQLASAAAIMIPYLLLTEDLGSIRLTGFSLPMLLIVGIVHTGMAYAMYFSSMNDLKAQSIAVLSYIDPVSALILSAVFLQESLSVFGIVGAVLIIGAALFSEMEFPKPCHGSASCP